MPLSNQIFPWVSAAPELKYALFYVRSTKSGLYCVFNVSMLLHVFLFHFLTETFLLLRGERYSLVIAQPSVKPFSSSCSFPFFDHLPAHGAKGRLFLGVDTTGFLTSSSSTDSLTLLCSALPPCRPSPLTACSSSFCILAASLRFRRASLTLLPTILIRERAPPWS